MGNFNEEYQKLRKKRLNEGNGVPDPANPPTQASPFPTTLPSEVYNYVESKAPKDVKGTEKNDEDTWFQASKLWDDGHQMWDVSKTILGTVTDVGEHVVSGAISIIEKAIDGLAMLGQGYAQNQIQNAKSEYEIYDAVGDKVFGENDVTQEDIDKAFDAPIKTSKKNTEEFVKKDLYDEGKIAEAIITDPVYNVTDVNAKTDSVLGEKSDALVESGGQLLGTAGLQAIGVPWYVTTGLTAMGSESENALNQGATFEEAYVSAAITAGAEILTEKISGGISFGGKTGDVLVKEGLSTAISNKLVRYLINAGVDVVGEGGEEVVSSVASRFGQWITYQDEATLEEMFLSEEAFDEYLDSFIGGAVLGGVSSGSNVVKSEINGMDAVTDLTNNEQAVVDKVYKDTVAEMEADGTKLTVKEKSDIRKSIFARLKKGYISTEEIEGVLGGEGYNRLKTEFERSQELAKELDTLRNMKTGEMTDVQIERMNELKATQTDTELLNTLKFSVDDSIRKALEADSNKLKDRGSYLAESYNEQYRRGQAYEADLSKYDETRRKIIQNAIDSGILNNTNRTHDFVDMVANISADKGVLFDFANNEKIKESGFAIEGKTVNGYVTKDGVTLNMDSAKSLNSVVGHEISHVLEGTELYTELSTAITEYAKSKGDYQARYDALKELYKGVKDADIDAELTADLVGDYLFTDEKFVNNLSVQNRNVFKKLWDEIEYLYNLAVAGSKEKRELERVKKVFEKAYKAGGNAQAGTKYSMSDSTGKALTKEQNDYFKDSKMRDENGNLKVMYHGSQNAGFHIFDPSMSDDGTSLFFVDRNDVAASYSGTSETYEAQTIKTAEDMNNFIESIGAEGYEVAENNGKFTLYYEGDRIADSDTAKGIYEEFCWYEGVGEGDANYKVYLNLTNPLEIDAKGRPWNKIDAEFSQEIYDKYNSLTPEEKAALIELAEWEDFRLFNSEVQEARGDAVASAYEKMGENCNIYDLFSVAADNFSEEAMRENARGYLKTRDYAQRAKEGGYDGVIFKNIHDNGGYSNGSEGASTVAIAFNSEQVKSVANEKPTKNPDIRYSISKDIENSDNSWYNEIKLPSAEQERIQSAALTWHPNQRNQHIVQTISYGRNDITYKYVIDDDGIVHVYGRKTADNIHERRNEYDIANREKSDSITEELWLGQRNNSRDINFSRDGRKPRKDDTNDNRIVSGAGRSDRAGYSQNRANAYGKPKRKGWHFNDDGSYDVTYSDGTQENIAPIKEASSSDDVFFDGKNPKFSLSADSEGRKLSPAVATRFGNSKAVDENGSLKVLYHGTAAGEFSIFDKSKGSVEGDFGSGFYFTDNEYDVSNNYEDGGPDFDNKVSRRAEQIYDEALDDDNEITYDEAEKRAREELYKGGHRFEVYLNIENPAIVGETILFDPDSYYSEYNQEDYDNEDDYYGDVEQLVSDDIDGIIWDIENKVDIYNTDGIADVLWGAFNEGGLDLETLKKRLNSLYLEDSNGNLVANEVARQIVESLGYDGIIDPTVSGKWRNMDMESGTTHYIVFKPNQIKAITNESPTDNPDIHKSLSAEGSTPKRYGSYNVYGKDISLPMRADISKVENTHEGIAENATTTPEMVAPMVDKAVDKAVDESVYPEDFAPMEHSSKYEGTVEGVKFTMDRLSEEASRLYAEGKTDEAQAIIERMQELNESTKGVRDKYNTLRSQERADTEGYLNSLTDADAPPEMEAPYYEDGGIIDPFEDRDVQEVGNRKVKAFMDENPEVKPYFQEEANILLGELQSATKGEKMYIPTPDGHLDKDGSMVYGTDSYGIWMGTSRSATDDIVKLLDDANGNGRGYTYAEIEKGLKDIIEDNGKENNACSKRIEFVINDRLMNGYTTSGGVEVPANQEYRNLIKEKGVLAGREEAFRRLIKDANKSVPAEDIAPLPTYDTASKAQIPGQQTFEPAAEETKAEAPKTEAKTEEPKIAKVLPTTPKHKQKVNLISKIRELLVDKQSAIEDLSLKTHNRDLMGKADFMLRSESRAQRHIKKKLMPILEKVEKTGKRTEYETYAYHLHNIDRMSIESNAQARIKELEGKFGRLKPEQIKAIAAKEITDKTTERTANTIREAKEYLSAQESTNLPVFGDEVTADISRKEAKKFEAENPDAKKISEALIEYNAELRQILVDNGVISQETADYWAKKYPRYLPIKRAGKDGPAVNVALDTKRTGVDAPIKRATGGNSDMESLFDTMASRTEQVYRAIARNNFGLELMHTLNTVVDTESVSIDEILDTFDNKYDELLKEGKNGANPTFTVFENGKRVTFDITEDLYNALKPTNDVLKADVPIMSQLTKIQRGLLTQYNPTFIATNAVKDIQDVIVNSQHPLATYAQVPEAVKELLTGAVGKEGKWIAEYMDNGGEDLTYFDSRKQVFKKDSAIKKVLGFVPSKIAAANDFVEKIPRLAEYIASRKKGASIEVSMLDAARVTTNFAAGGDLTKFANRNGFTFLNASIQGATQQVRNIREAKANGLKGCLQLAAKFAVAGLPVMLFNALRWDDDEDYEELSDYVKDNYYIIAKTEDGKFIRIPKGRTVAVIQSAFEQMKNLVTGDDEVDMGRFGQLLVENIAPNNPLDNNVLAPIMQVANNKTWYGGDLVPSRLQDLPDAEQYDETTDSISKWLGEKLDYSPYKINYLLDQYSGGIGDAVLPYLTPESDGSGFIAPLSDKFTTDSTMKNQNVTDFYDTLDTLTKNANSSKATDKDILANKYMNTVRTEISDLYTQKREIQNSDLSDTEKDELVHDIQEQINSLAKEALDTYGTVNISGNYATVGDLHYRWNEPDEDSEAEAGWVKITDKQFEKQEEVTRGLGITPSEYWGNKEEYDFAYESPGKYAVSKAVGGYDFYKSYSSDMYNIKGVDKDGDGKSDTGTRKDNIATWLNGLDIDYGAKIILFKSEYPADDTYNYDIIEYLNNRNDISRIEMIKILTELGFTVDLEGNIYWD